ATSYLDEAERCGRLGLIHRGRLMAEDTPDGIRKAYTPPGGEEPDLEEVFASLVRESVAS
ncbi:MAG: ABC transporter ATP-binding protein, partial [Pseudomonadota bacterium]